MDRRELIKRFGIGAIIAPVIGGVVERSASAELIKVPDIKPVELFSKIPEPLDLNDVASAQIVLGMKDGQTRAVALKWVYFAAPSIRDFVDVTTHSDAYRKYAPGLLRRGDGKIHIIDSLAVNLDFIRLFNTASPRAEQFIGRLSGDAVLT